MDRVVGALLGGMKVKAPRLEDTDASEDSLQYLHSIEIIHFGLTRDDSIMASVRTCFTDLKEAYLGTEKNRCNELLPQADALHDKGRRYRPWSG